ncbi:uncharacterized protein [Haliotis asinina]|uniref:uncharacterized protein n=1 Tax=Haliotis asinina TaxID=109174 RepID=UPI003531DA1C
MSIRLFSSAILTHLRLHKISVFAPVRYSRGFAPFGKPGSGNYGRTLGKQTVGLMELLRDKILNRVKSIPFNAKDSVFSIGDYGAADGSASVPFIGQLVANLKDQHGPEAQFQVIYEDTEVNDFNSLFKRVSGIIPDPQVYLPDMDNVYVLASGTDFYKQCVPSNSMHFIMCMISLHWLSETPVKYNNSLYKYPESSAEEKIALDRQAEIDLETFLLLRSREMKQGGLLIICAGCEINDMNTGEVKYLSDTLLTFLTEIWKEYRDSGKISNDEFLNTNLSLCFRNMDQLRKPFDDKLSAVSKSGLCLLSAETVIIPDIVYTAWKDKKDKKGIDDREEFARLYVATHRNWGNHTFLNGLSDSRSQEEKEKIVDGFYDKVEKRMSKINPEEIKDDFRFICLVVTKK